MDRVWLDTAPNQSVSGGEATDKLVKFNAKLDVRCELLNSPTYSIYA